MTLLLQTKDDDRRDVEAGASPLDAPKPPPTADEYRAILIKHRKADLKLTRENLNRLAQTYDRALETILQRIEALPDGAARYGTPWINAQLSLFADIRTELDRYRREYADMLDVSMIASAQQVADREAEVARLVGAPPQQNLFPTFERTVTVSGVEVSVRYGALALEAVQGVANRYYSDGLNLSERLYNLTGATKQTLEDAIVEALATGTSARDLAEQIREIMSADGVDTPRYRAMRIARSEISTAFREAHTRSTIDPATGGMKSYIAGIRWNLSLSHEIPDICDVWAAHDEGLGPGIYSADSVPSDHPHGLCFQTSELKELPGVIPKMMTTTPDVSKVPPSQISYYAQRGDAPAQALLAKGE